MHYVSKILVTINEPCLGGMDVYLERLKTVQSWIRIVCGIAMTLTDDASSMMCSQCLFIGTCDLIPFTWNGTDANVQLAYLRKMTESVKPLLRCSTRAVRGHCGGRAHWGMI